MPGGEKNTPRKWRTCLLGVLALATPVQGLEHCMDPYTGMITNRAYIEETQPETVRTLLPPRAQVRPCSIPCVFALSLRSEVWSVHRVRHVCAVRRCRSSSVPAMCPSCSTSCMGDGASGCVVPSVPSSCKPQPQHDSDLCMSDYAGRSADVLIVSVGR